MKAGGSYLPADMVCQFHVQTCADRTGTTGDRVWLRLFERAIDAGARDLPHARNSRQTITASKGGRERLAHRLDLLWAKGRLPSSAAILASSSSLSMVISPTLDFSRAISSSRSSCSRSFKAPAAPARARSRHSVSLATGHIHLSGHQIQRLAAQQSRDDRHLALNGKALRAGHSHRRPKGRLRQLWPSAP